MCRPTKKESREIHRIRAAITALPLIEEAEAEASGAEPVTDTYFTRLLGQCEMLLRALEGEKKERVILVRTRGGIAIWRKR